MNNVDYLITAASVKGWDILGNSEQSAVNLKNG